MTVSALALRHQSGASCSVQRYANSTPTQFGDEFGTTVGFSTENSTVGMVINVSGEVFALASNGIYRKQNPLVNAGPWELMHTFVTSIYLGKSTGFALFDVAGVPTLACVLKTAAADWQYIACTMPMVRPYTWSESSPFTISGVTNLIAAWPDNMGGSNWIKYGSQFIMMNCGFDLGAVPDAFHRSTFQVNPFTAVGTGQTVASVQAQGNNRFKVSIALVNGRIILQDMIVGSEAMRIIEWTGTHTVRSTLSVGDAFNNEVSPSALFWPGSGDDFYLFYVDEVTDSLKCLKFTLDTNWTGTDITSAVVPPALSSLSAHTRVFVMADRTTNIGVTEYLIGVSQGITTLGSPIYFYKWNGEASLMTFVDSGGQESDSLPVCEHWASSGDYHYVPGELDVEITARVPTYGGSRISFVAHGDPVVVAHGGTTGTLVEGETLTGPGGKTMVVVRKNPNNDDSVIHAGAVTGGAPADTNVYTGAGGSITVSGTPNGGAADKIFRIYFMNASGVLTQGTLASTANGGSAVRVGNEVQNVVADGATTHSIVWNFIIDGLSSGSPTDVVPSIGV